MLAIKCFCFLLCIISEVCSNEYLYFGGTEEDSRPAENYVSVDSGASTGSTDELIRTQRSFWKLLKHRLFGECGNFCNNLNYNLGNGQNINTRPSLPLPFQPWQSLPLWQPLKPLFHRVNYDNYGTSNYDGGNGNPTNYGMNLYNGNGIHSSPGYDNVLPAPESVYKIPTELPLTDNATEDAYRKPTSKSVGTENSYNEQEIPTYTNDDITKVHQHSNRKVAQILYQPIIYVSPLYHANKALTQLKEEETRYGTQSIDDEESKRHLKSSLNFDQIKSENFFNSLQNAPVKGPSAIVTPYQTVPFSDTVALSLSHPLTNISMPPASTVYNIITPSSLHSLTGSRSPFIDSAIVPNVLYSNEPPSKNTFPLLHPKDPTAADHSFSTQLNPIKLTTDDQPYRVCPELFEEYQRQLTNMFSQDIYGGSSFVDAQNIQYY